ncbi:MAG TPA: D-alanyl-D-alanine carboxypeptidase family protein, partial [Thermoanaerobaculia bacterium]|nr:D-alanyl-D-alanine carboxypeptidase family protein [Thermoanaerobaculia bacterium]
ETSTKKVLFAENEHRPLPTASMAKMMTLLITMEEIRDGRLKYDTPVTISARASKMGGSQVYLRAGSVWPIKNLLIATMVQSANDAAQALAEKIAGSSENFADMMNQRSQELGLTHTKFYDPHGLPNPSNPQMVDTMCPHDLAILGLEITKYPFLVALSRIPEMPFRNGTLEKIYNPNHLINPRKANFMEDATGIKTGYSGPAGYCVTASAKRGDMEVVAVIMGSKTGGGPNGSFANAGRLMNEAFVNWRMATPAKKGTQVGQATVAKGAVATVPVVAGQNVTALVRRGQERSVKMTFQPGNPVTAPVKKGQPIGTIIVQSGSDVIARIPGVAGADVASEPWYKAFLPF